MTRIEVTLTPSMVRNLQMLDSDLSTAVRLLASRTTDGNAVSKVDCNVGPKVDCNVDPKVTTSARGKAAPRRASQRPPTKAKRLCEQPLESLVLGSYVGNAQAGKLLGIKPTSLSVFARRALDAGHRNLTRTRNGWKLRRDVGPGCVSHWQVEELPADHPNHG